MQPLFAMGMLETVVVFAAIAFVLGFLVFIMRFKQKPCPFCGFQIPGFVGVRLKVCPKCKAMLN